MGCRVGRPDDLMADWLVPRAALEFGCDNDGLSLVLVGVRGGRFIVTGGGVLHCILIFFFIVLVVIVFVTDVVLIVLGCD